MIIKLQQLMLTIIVSHILSGADASSLEIDSSMNGELRFKEAPDYEERVFIQ